MCGAARRVRGASHRAPHVVVDAVHPLPHRRARRVHISHELRDVRHHVREQHGAEEHAEDGIHALRRPLHHDVSVPHGGDRHDRPVQARHPAVVPLLPLVPGVLGERGRQQLKLRDPAVVGKALGGGDGVRPARDEVCAQQHPKDASF